MLIIVWLGLASNPCCINLNPSLKPSYLFIDINQPAAILYQTGVKLTNKFGFNNIQHGYKIEAKQT